VIYQQDVSTLVIEHCCKCGTPFGIEDTLHRQLKRTGNTFYCPNGHPQIYTNPIENQLAEAKKALKATEEERVWWKNEAETKAAQLKSTRTQLTKTRNRIAKGICPCCHRQFVNLHRHMDTKHPDYNSEEVK